MTDIALVLVAASGGGAERAMIGVMNSLVKTGLKIDVVVVRKTGPFLGEIDPAIRVVDLGAGKVRKMLLPLAGYVKREKPTLIVSALTATDPFVLIGKALFRWKSKVHISVQNAPTASAVSDDFYFRIWPRVIRWFYRFAESLNAISAGVGRDVERLTGKPEGSIAVIHNPVDIPRAAAMAAERPSHPWLADKTEPVLLAVGRLTMQKDFPTLLRAHAKLRATRPVRLVILGEGEDRVSLEALAGELGTAESVAMPGFDANPFAAMAAADVFVLSSRWEGFANVVAEALACGTRVVSTDCPSGPAEILENGRYGTLVPIQHVEALADAMGAAIDAPVDRDALRARANDFALERIAAQYDAMFRERGLIG
ncbi:glycosyltransferase [Sphingomonas sp. LB-2]|uniref:glycosyltransferase n=1 Tax=Sphingomonas caeni TaxID=2984949 RepID=UPI002230EB03|nr:glycosyltransferase [Sphingomonas caeni]MCW3848506.1 glycosyltransferase [Sphingomonas caeni]